MTSVISSVKLLNCEYYINIKTKVNILITINIRGNLDLVLITSYSYNSNEGMHNCGYHHRS
uniref:Uncharacterized protein n=1 Tax=Heterorhabditis bacteriophora TaxID=37862 RepID=A0A1I7WHR3_HETBA